MFGHDTAAAVLEDGVVRAAIENDKLVHAGSRLPDAAILSCFESLSIDWDAIDIVAVGARPLQSCTRKIFLQSKLAVAAPISAGYIAAEEVGILARELSDMRLLQRRLASGRNKIVGFDHHLCHAASAFFLSSFDRALILTMDEEGDGTSALVAIGNGNHIRTLRRIAFPNSLAWIYSQITGLIGFWPHREEHKTQWLGLGGEPKFKHVFLKMLRSRGGALPHLDDSFFNRFSGKKVALSNRFFESTGLPSDAGKLSEQDRRDLASSVQAACGEIVTGLVERYCNQEGVRQVCFAGGLFQNVLLVASLESNLGRDRVFVPPAPGNAGSSLGAACLAWHHVLKRPRMPEIAHVYLGPKFGRQEIKDILDGCKNRYSVQNTEDRMLDSAVQLLQADKIIGWFQGAAEFGPRALGNRSVLASPWAAFVRENLNDFIKHREWFRPFAISVPEEDCSRYFQASGQCRFMNSVAGIAEGMPGGDCLPPEFRLPAGRVRLHVVEKRSNPLFWALLKRFGEQAPAPMLLNTSFNLCGDPLVVTPRNAMRSYFASGLDALIIDRFVLSKAAMRSVMPSMATSHIGVGA